MVNKWIVLLKMGEIWDGGGGFIHKKHLGQIDVNTIVSKKMEQPNIVMRMNDRRFIYS